MMGRQLQQWTCLFQEWENSSVEASARKDLTSSLLAFVSWDCKNQAMIGISTSESTAQFNTLGSDLALSA